MKLYSMFSRLLIAMLIILCVNSICFSQGEKTVKKLYGKIIEFDTLDKIIDWSFAKDHGVKYYHDVFHFRICSYLGDTVTVGILFELRSDFNSLLKKFGLIKDSAYIFEVSDINPCKSSFPSVRGCAYNQRDQTSEYRPREGQVCFPNSYKSLLWYMESAPMDPALWKELLQLKSENDKPK
jgi:hypothetical protein